MKILPLHVIPEAVTLIAEYNFKAWGRKNPNDSVEKTIQRIQARIENRRPPITLVAYEGQEYAGSVTLKLHEMRIYPERAHWLGDLLVVPEKRSRGIGTRLVSETEYLASSFGISKLHLYTTNQASFYERLGWEMDEYVYYENENVAVMFKELY